MTKCAAAARFDASETASFDKTGAAVYFSTTTSLICMTGVASV